MKTVNKFASTICGLLAFAALAGCAAGGVPHDPYEPYNRAMFAFNDKVDRAVLTPATRAYRTVVPKPARAAVTNVFDNLRDVVSFGSNVLRLDLKRASEDIMRVAFNTAFGLGGLINMADYAGMPDNKNTLGDTFASWGWKNSDYFIFPFSGPSTVRDSLGSVPIWYWSPESAVVESSEALWGIAGLRVLDSRDRYLGLSDAIEDAAPDRYAYVRDMYMGIRARQTGGTPPAGAEEELNIDDLMSSDDDDSPAADTDATSGAAATSAEKLVAPPESETASGLVSESL